MIYVDVSHLHDFLRKGRNLSGIQRLTLNALVGLERRLGSQALRVMIFSLPDNGYRFYAVAAFLAEKGRKLPAGQLCSFNVQDKILLPEYFWNSLVTVAAAKRSTFRGAKIYRIVYDVIPVALPKLFAGSWVRKFRRYVSEAITNCDVVLTISDFSKADILKHFPKECVSKPIEVLKPPHEFIGSANMFGEVTSNERRPAGADGLVDQSFALIVGSLEGRKNVQLAVRAWQTLSKEHRATMPKLVIVGAYTSHDPIYKMRLRWTIRSTPSILHLSSCDDSGLEWLYRHCRFTISLSSYEGWGLPVGESLWFGKPVLASNATSLPEVGPGLADYVDATDAKAVLNGIRKLCFDDAFFADRSNAMERHKLRTWDQFTEALAACLK